MHEHKCWASVMRCDQQPFTKTLRLHVRLRLPGAYGYMRCVHSKSWSLSLCPVQLEQRWRVVLDYLTRFENSVCVLAGRMLGWRVCNINMRIRPMTSASIYIASIWHITSYAIWSRHPPSQIDWPVGIIDPIIMSVPVKGTDITLLLAVMKRRTAWARWGIV